MRRITTHVAVAAVALTAGAAGSAALFAGADPVTTTASVSRPAPAPPEQVRTVVVTRTIHRVRHVHVRPRRPAPVSAPPVPVSAPPPPVRTAAPIAVAPRTIRSAPATQRPLRTRTSGHGGSRGHEDGAEHEHENAGGDD